MRSLCIFATVARNLLHLILKLPVRSASFFVFSKIIFLFNMKKTTLLLYSLITGIFIHAQQSQSELDTVTISSSLRKENVSATGRNITVIRGDQFLKQPVHSLDELLRYIPGIEVQQRGPMGSQSDIVLRGGTFQQVLVILDGIRLNDPNTGHFNSYIPIAPFEIDRIEILKGAASAIYGSEAVGGVIHIITKSFARKQQGSTDRAAAQASIGSFGLASANVGAYNAFKNTSFGGGVLVNHIKGEQQRGIHGYADNRTASLSVSHSFNSNWTFSLRSAYDSRDFAAQNFYTTFLSDTASEQVDTWWNQLNLTYGKGKNNFSFSAGYKKLEDTYRFNPSSLANSNHSTLWQALAFYSGSLKDKHNWTTGIQFLDRSISSNDRGMHHVKEIAQFNTITFYAGPYVLISPGVRFDWVEENSLEVVPQLNISYKKGSWLFRGSGGKTIRNADFTELYNNYNKSLVTGGRIGNPDLDAERSLSYEAGADYFFKNNWKISGGFYQRFQKRLIDYIPTPYANMPRKDNLIPTGSYALASNIAEVTTIGVEMDMQYAGKNLFSTFGIVWQDSKSDTVPSFYISSHAKLLFNFNFQYTFKNLSCSVNGLYKMRTPQNANGMVPVSENYFLFNLRAGWNIFQNSNVFLEVDNVLDTDAADLLGTPLPGRWISGGLSVGIR